VPDPVRKLERTRREAARFAAEARRLVARRRKRLPKGAAAEIEEACEAVERAVKDGDPGRLSVALHALDALWAEHLARLAGPPWREYLLAVLAGVAVAFLLRGTVAEPLVIRSGAMAPTLLAGDLVLVTKLGYGPRLPFTGFRPVGAAPRRGDVVILESPRAGGRPVARRVVGVPGDVVELRDETLLVNGVPQPRVAAGEASFEDRGDDGGGPIAETCRRYREALARGPLSAAGSSSWQTAAAVGVANHEVLLCRRTRLAPREGPWQVVQPGYVLVLGDHRDGPVDGRLEAGAQVPLAAVKGRVGLVLASWRADAARGPGRPRLERLFKVIE
jgi:signal peptidase I